MSVFKWIFLAIAVIVCVPAGIVTLLIAALVVKSAALLVIRRFRRTRIPADGEPLTEREQAALAAIAATYRLPAPQGACDDREEPS